MTPRMSPRKTDRLTLRAPLRSDLDDLAVIYANEGVNRYLYSQPRNREQTRALLEKRIAQTPDASGDNVLFIVAVFNETNRVIGDFMLRWGDNEHRQGEIGGSLHPDFHGRGIASEVYRELLEVGFIDYDLHRIVGRCDGRNRASIRSLEKVGLRQEAHLVENEFVKGEWTDEVILAILQDTWRQRTTGDTKGQRP
ncbi:MAG: GNAT family N-acetyltransferase [Acidobacteria bacterium]|nr:GNAT family N-acetyltransferase [Acidobacteriota bacterium]